MGDCGKAVWETRNQYGRDALLRKAGRRSGTSARTTRFGGVTVPNRAGSLFLVPSRARLSRLELGQRFRYERRTVQANASGGRRPDHEPPEYPRPTTQRFHRVPAITPQKWKDIFAGLLAALNFACETVCACSRCTAVSTPHCLAMRSNTIWPRHNPARAAMNSSVANNKSEALQH